MKNEIKLTRNELVVLEELDSKWKYIARDENGCLYLYEEEPCKSGCCWSFYGFNRYIDFGLFARLFPFIKWEDEEPWEIAELIELGQKQNNNHWIPVSDRLPKDSEAKISKKEQVLVCNVFGIMNAAYCHKGRWYKFSGKELADIVAWQPLPAPYEEKEK